MGLHPDRPFELARSMVDAVAGYYDDQGVPLPEPRFVTTGDVVADCELLAVAVLRMFNHAGDVSAEVVQPITRAPGAVMRGLVVAVTVLRCVPNLDDNGEPPSAGEIEAGARPILADAQHVWDALQAARRDGRLTSCNSIAWVGWDAYGPEGDIAGGTLTVRAGLE